jgi:hypothetical protein
MVSTVASVLYSIDASVSLRLEYTITNMSDVLPMIWILVLTFLGCSCSISITKTI